LDSLIVTINVGRNQTTCAFIGNQPGSLADGQRQQDNSLPARRNFQAELSGSGRGDASYNGEFRFFWFFGIVGRSGAGKQAAIRPIMIQDRNLIGAIAISGLTEMRDPTRLRLHCLWVAG